MHRTLLIACAAALLGGTTVSADVEVRVGSKKFTESVILGEIATQIAAASGVTARHSIATPQNSPAANASGLH